MDQIPRLVWKVLVQGYRMSFEFWKLDQYFGRLQWGDTHPPPQQNVRLARLQWYAGYYKGYKVSTYNLYTPDFLCC